MSHFKSHDIFQILRIYRGELFVFVTEKEIEKVRFLKFSCMCVRVFLSYYWHLDYIRTFIRKIYPKNILFILKLNRLVSIY